MNEDFLVCFETILNKGEIELIVLGSENGVLQLMNKNGTI